MKNGLKPSAFSSAARWRAVRALASSSRFFSAADCSMQLHPPEHFLVLADERRLDLLGRELGLIVVVDLATRPRAVEELAESPFRVVELVVLGGLGVLDDPGDLAQLDDAPDDEVPADGRPVARGTVPLRPGPPRPRRPARGEEPAGPARRSSRQQRPDLVPQPSRRPCGRAPSRRGACRRRPCRCRAFRSSASRPRWRPRPRRSGSARRPPPGRAAATRATAPAEEACRKGVELQRRSSDRPGRGRRRTRERRLPR